jgi:hypothetical protein
MRKSSYLLALLVACLVSSSQAPAKTPNVTPADAGVCDGLRDGNFTKGLYGLCVAYCEAQDCTFDDTGELPESCSSSDDRILESYNRMKSESDPDMPCVATQTACPCWEPEDLQAAGSFDGAIGFCFNDPDGVQAIYLFGPSSETQIYSVPSIFSQDPNTCLNFDNVNNPLPIQLEIDAVANEECRRQLVEEINARFGGVCF